GFSRDWSSDVCSSDLPAEKWRHYISFTGRYQSLLRPNRLTSASCSQTNQALGNGRRVLSLIRLGNSCCRLCQYWRSSVVSAPSSSISAQRASRLPSSNSVSSHSGSNRVSQALCRAAQQNCNNRQARLSSSGWASRQSQKASWKRSRLASDFSSPRNQASNLVCSFWYGSALLCWVSAQKLTCGALITARLVQNAMRWN